MVLSDVFSDEFIARLNNLNEDGHVSPNEEVKGFIDVEKILGELGFQVHIEQLMYGSGKIENTKIYIDGSENKRRQRFSMAHELGHAVQNVRYANRQDDPNDYDAFDRQDEVFANAFASQFLMPKGLVKQEIRQAIDEKGLDSRHLESGDVEKIIRSVAQRLKVSKMALKYRTDNLGIFVPAEGK